MDDMDDGPDDMDDGPNVTILSQLLDEPLEISQDTLTGQGIRFAQNKTVVELLRKCVESLEPLVKKLNNTNETLGANEVSLDSLTSNSTDACKTFENSLPGVGIQITGDDMPLMGEEEDGT